jgi:YD repeat-containing protein
MIKYLSNSTVTAAAIGPYASWTSGPYSYDGAGNIKAIAGTSGRGTPTSSQTNRLSSAAVSYDGAGNLIAWNGATYAYDAFNQMVQMTSGAENWAYLYTADDERVWSYDVARNASRWTLRDLGGKCCGSLRATRAIGTWGAVRGVRLSSASPHNLR